jgi:uncharacterized NAD-dependent epimerase/dehydratase family protein
LSLNDEIEIEPVSEWIELHERMAAYLKPAPVVGIAINGWDLNESEARAWAERIEAEAGRVTVDPVKFGAERLIEAIIASQPATAAERH